MTGVIPARSPYALYDVYSDKFATLIFSCLAVDDKMFRTHAMRTNAVQAYLYFAVDGSVW